MRKSLYALAVLVTAIIACSFALKSGNSSNSKTQSNSKIDNGSETFAAHEKQKFADFAVKTFDGKEGKLSDYVGKGNYVLVDFWAYWCGWCIKEVPYLQKVNEAFAEKNFQLISISVDKDVEKTVLTAEKNGMTWTQLIAEDLTVLKSFYKIKYIPRFILFSPDGTILDKDLSARGEKIQKALEKYFE